MGGFMMDVAAQPAVIRRVVAASGDRLDGPLRAAASILLDRPDRPVVATGMGSSLAAGRVVRSVLGGAGRWVELEDAGEFLHYGLAGASGLGSVIAVSQSGRSAETARVAEELRARGGVPIIAVVNDPDSPVARSADVVIDLDVGVEAAVATRTYVGTLTVLALLAGRVVPGGPGPADIERAAHEMDAQLHDTEGAGGARHMAGCRALIVVGRGPALGAADYAALTIKETAAIPAESMAGGAFRHGPLELATTDVGFIFLAPAGAAADLVARAAREVAAGGSRTWLLADAALAHAPDDPAALLGTALPALPEALAPLACVVPLQQAADELARAAGRRAGVTVVATKVTDRE